MDKSACWASMRKWIQIISTYVQTGAQLRAPVTPVLWGRETGGSLGVHDAGITPGSVSVSQGNKVESDGAGH